jgi:hypothetical protein
LQLAWKTLSQKVLHKCSQAGAPSKGSKTKKNIFPNKRPKFTNTLRRVKQLMLLVTLNIQAADLKTGEKGVVATYHVIQPIS